MVDMVVVVDVIVDVDVVVDTKRKGTEMKN